ncbi:hypothetical protein Mapa_009038 [Marchantia paleacea]|nr:hypothetical protein Mapa_009038 [Marchantia paleacea]
MRCVSTQVITTTAGHAVATADLVERVAMVNVSICREMKRTAAGVEWDAPVESRTTTFAEDARMGSVTTTDGWITYSIRRGSCKPVATRF